MTSTQICTCHDLSPVITNKLQIKHPGAKSPKGGVTRGCTVSKMVLALPDNEEVDNISLSLDHSWNEQKQRVDQKPLTKTTGMEPKGYQPGMVLVVKILFGRNTLRQH